MNSTKFSNPRISSRRFWQDVFDLFRIRKKTIHWGTVFDSRTKQPIDPAVVELVDALTGEVKQTVITDLWGKYGFLAEHGDYAVRVRRGHYSFPSKIVTGTADGIYQNVYHGEQISIADKWGLITPNIPLDPVGTDYNQEAKTQFAVLHPRSENFLRWTINLLFWGLFAVSGILFFVDPSPVHAGVFGLFVLLAGLRFLLPPRPLWGTIYTAETGDPLGFADIELFVPEQAGILIAKTRSAHGSGKYFLKVREGEYIMRITDPFSRKLLAEGLVTIHPDGIFTSDIYV